MKKVLLALNIIAGIALFAVLVVAIIYGNKIMSYVPSPATYWRAYSFLSQISLWTGILSNLLGLATFAVGMVLVGSDKKNRKFYLIQVLLMMIAQLLIFFSLGFLNM